MTEEVLEQEEIEIKTIEDVQKISDAGDRSDAIRKLAERERDMEKNPEKYKNEEIKSEESDATLEEGTSEDSKDKGSEESDTPEEGTIEDTPEEETVDKESEEPEEKAENDSEKVLSDYAEKKEITLEEAKQEFDSVSKIVSKYGGNADDLKPGDANYEIAKANLHYQRSFTRSQMELKELQKKNEVKFLIADDKIVWGGVERSRDKVVEEFRKAYPAKSESLDDDEIYDEAKIMLQTQYNNAAKKTDEILKEKAEETRAIMVNNIPDEDAKYFAEIKTYIDKMPANVIASDDGRLLDDIVLTVRGKHYHEDIRAAEKKAFEKGRNEAKIINQKKTEVTPGSKPKPQPKLKITEAQKKEALEMFSARVGELSNEKIFELYLSIKQ